jgi:hypothetical protein
VLKITVTESATDRRWIVQGRLVGPWVNELRTAWKRAHRSQDKRACIIDLNDVTFIDKSGERLLRAISKKGAHLVANGLYVKHVLEHLQSSGKRGLVALMVCFFAGLQTNAMVPVARVQEPSVRMETKVNGGCGLRCNFANPWTRSTERSLSATRAGAPVALTKAIGGVKATNLSADRAVRTEDQ